MSERLPGNSIAKDSVLNKVLPWRRPNPNQLIITDQIEDLTVSNIMLDLRGRLQFVYSYHDPAQPGRVSDVSSNDPQVIDHLQAELVKKGFLEEK